MSSSTQFASRNQLANILNIPRPAVDYLLLVAGAYTMRRRGTGIELRITEAGRQLTDPNAPFDSWNVEEVRALVDKHIAPELNENRQPLELPDEFVSRNRLCGLIGMSDAKLSALLVKAGVFCTTSNSIKLGSPTQKAKATGIVRPNKAKGIYELNAKRIGAVLAQLTGEAA